MGFIKKVFDLFVPDSDVPVVDTLDSGKVNNNVLYHELIEHFKEDMEDLSVNRRILYPMSFNILMHPEDYKRVGESLPFILPEVVAGFYAAIKDKSSTVVNADATNPAKYWFFQFAQAQAMADDDNEAVIVPGQIVTVGHLTTFDIKKAQQGNISEDVKLSVKVNNSNVNKGNINMQALLGMDIISNNAFTFNFDRNMSEELNDIRSLQKSKESSLASLTYSIDGRTVQFAMCDDLLIISGSGETRTMDNIMVIDSDAVDVGHVQIRYLPDSNKFQLCAYSNTRLNMRGVPISSGGSPIWRDMPYNSDIFLNEEINIKFKASASILK